MRERMVAPVICALVVSACGSEEIPLVDGITRVSVHTSSFCETLNVITDSAQVAAIEAFVNDRRQGWGGARDIAGTPVGQINAYLHDDAESLNDGVVETFSAGPGFFVSHIRSRHASQDELDEFARIIGVPSAWLEGGVPRDSLAARDARWTTGFDEMCP